MAKRQAAGQGTGSGSGGKRSSAAADGGVSPLSRWVGENFYTILVVAGLVTAVAGWKIYDRMNMGLEVTASNYSYVGLGLLLFAAVGIYFLIAGDGVREVLAERRFDEESLLMVKQARRMVKRGAIPEARREQVMAAADAVDEAGGRKDRVAMKAALPDLEAALGDHLPNVRRTASRSNGWSIVLWVLAVLCIRWFLAEPFKIPSGSMIPTLQVGDEIFVNKYIYGLRIPFTDVKFGMRVRGPGRGEVAVFEFPNDKSQDFIKRIVAIDGDTVEVRDDVVYVNGEATPRRALTEVPCEYEDFDERTDRWQHRLCDGFEEKLGGHVFTTIYDRGSSPRTFPKVTVPKGHVFVMGDNRDNSNDSRYWGTVPFEYLRGRAMFVFWSSGQPEGIRFGRMGRWIE